MTDLNETGISTADDYLYGVLKNRITPLPIVFDEMTAPQTSARMYVYVINPYSKHIDDAIHFVECMLRPEVDYKLYYAIHPNVNDPYPDPNYEQTREHYLQQKEAYETAIQRAIAENQSYNENMDYRVQYYKEWLDNEDNQWLIKGETIDAFRKAVQDAPINVHAESPYVCDEGTSSFEIVTQACAKYADGYLTLDTFLKEISSKMRMIYLEER